MEEHADDAGERGASSIQLLEGARKGLQAGLGSGRRQLAPPLGEGGKGSEWCGQGHQEGGASGGSTSRPGRSFQMPASDSVPDGRRAFICSEPGTGPTVKSERRGILSLRCPSPPGGSRGSFGRVLRARLVASHVVAGDVAGCPAQRRAGLQTALWATGRAE